MNAAAFGSEPPAGVTVTPVTRAPRPRTRTKAAPADPAIMAPALADDVAGLEAVLGRSLGVAPGPDGFAPGAFVRAVKVIHDRLQGVRDDLAQRQRELDEREMALEAALRAVQRREELAAASLALVHQTPSVIRPARSRGILGWLFGR